MKRRPPSKPRKLQRKGRRVYYGQYWADTIDSNGAIIGRHQVQAPLFDDIGSRISTPRKADQACDDLYEKLMAEWSGTIDGATPLADYKTRYIAARSRRKGTSRSYDTKLQQLFEFLKREHEVKRFAEVGREMVKAYLDARLEQVKLVTVHGDLRAIRAFFNEAVRDGHLKDNPCKHIKLPQLQGSHVSEGFFLPNEMDAIVEYCRNTEPKWYPIFSGFRYAPFRREELCYLEWDDVDFHRAHIRIQDEKADYQWRPKRSGRTMDLHPCLKQILLEMDQQEGFVFQHPDGAVYDDTVTERRELGRKAWRKIKSLCEHLELAEKDTTGSWDRRFPNGSHLKAFRSGISCELQLKGAPLGYVQEQLGHHDQSMTLEHYTHLVPELMGDLTKKFISHLGS